MASATEQAVRRLEAALAELERAIQRRLEQTAGSEGLGDEVRMLTADRARLAENLDQSQARVTRLENVSRDVSRRVAAAVETIGAVLKDETGRT